MDMTVGICPQCEKGCRVAMVEAQLAEACCPECQQRLPLHGVINEVDDHLLRLLIKQSPKLLVVDFYANWCAPCKEYAPIFSQIADHFYQDMVFAKISCEFNPVMAQSLGVKGIPHTLFFKAGQEVYREVGVITLEKFKGIIENI
jgi:thioredoxin